MANLLAYRDIPENSTITVNLTKLAHGILVQNNTNVFVFINNDRGALLLSVPPGLTLGWNEPDGVFAPQVGCNGLYQGNGRVYFYDDNLDLSNNPAALQPPGTIDIANGSITVQNGTIDIGNTPNVNDATAQARLQSLLDSIGSTRVTLTANNGVVTTANFIVPVSHFTIQPVTIRRPGLFQVQIVGGGVSNNTLLADVYVRGAGKVPWDFDADVPANFAVLLNFAGDGDFSVSY